MQMRILALAITLTVVVPAHGHAAEGDEPDRQQRWTELSELLFDERPMQSTQTVISIDAPKRAEDAALVPVTIRTEPGAEIIGTAIIIDDNPSPVAARIKFGPAGDPRQMKLRVRIDGYTNVHAVAETREGKLLQNARFVKASGGCSAPSGTSEEAAARNMGEMRMKFGSNEEMGGAPEATLMVRHPNFNGMQMNQVTRTYTPARYINAIDVSRGDQNVFAMEADISLSTNPVITFLYKPEGNLPFRVTVRDTDGNVWAQDFTSPQATN